MINTSDIKIELSYKVQSLNAWCDMVIKAEEYFDINYIEGNEVLDIDAIPLYDHAIDYINIANKTDISNTKLIIMDKETKKSKLIIETLWNLQKNSIVERIDRNSDGHTLCHKK